MEEEGQAEGQLAGGQGAQLPAGAPVAQLALGQHPAQQAAGQAEGGHPQPGDLFELLLATADMVGGQGLTRSLVASFYALLDGLPAEHKDVRVSRPAWAGGASWQARVLCSGWAQRRRSPL